MGWGGDNTDDEETRKAKASRSGGNKGWGVRLSCQLVLGANTHVTQGESGGKSEVRETRLSSEVDIVS